MPICMNCGKYMPEKDPKPWPKTEEEIIEAFQFRCTSFTYCTECYRKLFIKESED